MLNITGKQLSRDVKRLRYLIFDYVQLPSLCALTGLMDYSRTAANQSQILLMPNLHQGKLRETVAQSLKLHKSKTGYKAH